MTNPRRRGTYAKTAAKRKLILDAALAAYAEAGSRGVSVTDIAQRVGMTDAGVLHHFGSREALLTAVLEARDAAYTDTYGEAEALWRPDMVSHYASTPGLSQLFLDLAAAATEPGHPGHTFFTERYHTLRARFTDAFAAGRPAEGAPPTAAPDAAWAARMIIAASDGLQFQWLLEPSIDMADDLARLRDLMVDALGTTHTNHDHVADDGDGDGDDAAETAADTNATYD
ncbi:TetR/AcrR family transcriptional regulator [Streptomyces sp. NRRL S-87]|uniref:TetR/AcrR family transcriptional regulator n=1 Tax=Streptomyces sp. NRRL S-87 TaxID=1463920 RepID=UPI000691A98B|nr:TetR/AcrR family transcriptional regulator [Streptomyces sp. NRRL S-87]